MTKLAIIGGRDFADYPLLNSLMTQWFWDGVADRWRVSEVVSGGARGADSLGARWARENRVKLTEFIPDWDRFGKRAGFLRNEDIVQACDVVLAFWDGVSRGTGNSLSIAKRLKRTTLIVYYVAPVLPPPVPVRGL